eukprot:916689_1
MVVVTSIIILIIFSIISSFVNSQPPQGVCAECELHEECESLSCSGGLCMWGDIPPACSADFLCLLNDGSIFNEPEEDEEPPLSIIGQGCLRCCPTDRTLVSSGLACRETISTGQPHCGVYVEHFDALGITAPCCPGHVCLDDVAGICGETVDEPCGSCIRWSYVIGDETFDNVVGDFLGGIGPGNNIPLFEQVSDLQYRIFDDCGEGLICWPDSSKPQVSKSDHLVYSIGASLNIGRRRLVEEIEHRARRLQLLHGQDMVYETGVCIPEDGKEIDATNDPNIDDTCSRDTQCPICMRCCEGGCIRILDGENCGAEGRGPCCCKTDVCQYNECKTPSISPSISPSPAPSSAAPSGAPSPAPSKSSKNPSPAPTNELPFIYIKKNIYIYFVNVSHFVVANYIYTRCTHVV